MKTMIRKCISYCKDLKILYVEDNPEARTFTLEMLKRFFDDIVIAEDGQDGLNKFKDAKFDIVLTDINMPNMNGIDMIIEIKKMDNLIPIVILSAHNEEKFFLSGIKAGVDGYLLKPLDVFQFVETFIKSVEKIHFQKEIKLYKQQLEDTNEELEIKVKNRTAELEYRLYHDNLTDLENHDSMMKNISIDNNETLFLIDINGFQKFNDIYGLESGNEILKDIAKKLIDFDVDNMYHKYRVYGDVFVLQYKLGEISQEDFEIRKTRLLNYLESIKVYLDEIEESVEVDFTLGITLNQKNAFIKTDMALKFAKRENILICIYTDEINSSKKLLDDIYWKKEIKLALNNDNVVPVFQAIVDKSQKIVKYESLMRLRQYEKGEAKLISPSLFLDAAFNTQQYSKLTIAMIEKTFNFMKNKNVNFSINLSFEDLADINRMTFLKEKIKEYGVAKRLILEILESEVVSDYELVLDVLKEFRVEGVKIAIDDFGSGYSNFEHILKLKPDFLKIDASLVKNILEDECTFTLVKAISEFSKELKIKVIAEYVSSKEIFEALKALSIDEYQGYYFSIPSEELLL